MEEVRDDKKGSVSFGYNSVSTVINHKLQGLQNGRQRKLTCTCEDRNFGSNGKWLFSNNLAIKARTSNALLEGIGNSVDARRDLSVFHNVDDGRQIAVCRGQRSNRN